MIYNQGLYPQRSLTRYKNTYIHAKRLVSIKRFKIKCKNYFYQILKKIYVVVVVGGLVAKSCLTLAMPWTVLWPARLLCPWDSPGKNTGVGCHFPIQNVCQISIK